jgi:hypothetical protein
MGDTRQLGLEDLILAPGSWFAEGSLSMSLMSGATRFLMSSKAHESTTGWHWCCSWCRMTCLWVPVHSSVCLENFSGLLYELVVYI